MPWAFDATAPRDVWKASPEVQQKLEQTFAAVYEYVHAQPDIATANLVADPVFGKPLAERLCALADEVPVLKLLLDTFAEDADGAGGLEV
eukprot:5919800-Alexandrium_andersonii.AAC.1